MTDRLTQLAQKGRLAEKRERLAALKIKVDRLKKDIIHSLFTLESDDPVDIKEAHALQAAEELCEVMREFRGIREEVRQAEHG